MNAQQALEWRAQMAVRLRAARVAAGRPAVALAEASGLSLAAYTEIESGRRWPTLDNLYAFAGTLGKPVTALLPKRSSVPG